MSTNLYRDDYYNWLLGFIENDKYDLRDYSYLLDLLFSVEFYEIVKNDSNRVSDGLALRNEYASTVAKEHLYFVIEDLPPFCTCLEMMVALARRIEDNIMRDPDYGDRTSLWFWIMIENLGLSEEYDDVFDEEICRDILQKFVARNFSKSGHGSVFFLANPDCDMRNVEIWYQANYFLSENLSRFT